LGKEGTGVGKGPGGNGGVQTRSATCRGRSRPHLDHDRVWGSALFARQLCPLYRPRSGRGARTDEQEIYQTISVPGGSLGPRRQEAWRDVPGGNGRVLGARQTPVNEARRTPS